MSKVAHTIELNLPAYVTAPSPNPNKAAVTIDGVPFKHVRSVKVDCSSDPKEMTLVTIVFYAEVEGVIGAEKLIETARDELKPVK